MSCFPCSHPSEKPYDYHALAMFSHWGKLCDLCQKKFEAMKPPAKTYVLKPTPEPAKEKNVWMPPVVAAPKDYNDREPGEEG